MGYKRTLLLSTAILLAGGCATNSANIAPLSTPLSQYADLSCADLARTEKLVAERLALTAAVVDRSSVADRLVMGIGVVFWPALFLIDGKGEYQDKLARLKGEMQSIHDSQEIGGCRPARQVNSMKTNSVRPLSRQTG